MPLLTDKIKRVTKITVIFSITGILLFWLTMQDESNTITPVISSEPNTPDLSLVNSVSYHYNEQGQQQYRLTSEQVDHYKDKEKAYLIKPKLQSISDEALWHASANTGEADTKNELLSLKDNVRIERTSSSHPDHQKITLRTSELDIDTENQTIENEVLTIIHSGNSFIESTGIKSDLTSSETILKSKVRGTHDVQK